MKPEYQTLTQAVSYLRREVFRRRLPHGLIHPRYFLPKPPARIQVHKKLWLMSMPKVPRLLWICIETLLWLRWVSWSVWYRSFKCVQLFGKPVEEREHIPPIRQFFTVLRLSLLYCIPPSSIYRFKLYRTPERLWTYVFEHEIDAFHRARRRETRQAQESMALLQDKYGLEQHLKELMPMAKTLALLTKDSVMDFSSWPDSRLFCKLRRGNRAQGAFVVDTSGPEFRIRTFEGKILCASEAEAFIRKNLAKDDYLVQTCLQNHPALKTIGSRDEAITLRVISQKHGYYCATLIVPVNLNRQGWLENNHLILPVHIETGEILPHPQPMPGLEEAHYTVYRKANGLCIPYWQEILAYIARGQQQFPDINAIAWDLVISPTGPIVLEGNTNWGAIEEQAIAGGLLEDVNIPGEICHPAQ